MNAYELADELDLVTRIPSLKIVADTLRQQADRIAELEKPVKQITDTEIWAISTKFDLSHVYGICDFAREIERKIKE